MDDATGLFWGANQEFTMLTFAAPSDPAQTRGRALSDDRPQSDASSFVKGLGASLPATHSSTHSSTHPVLTRYWPCDLLNTFILKMAANGRCVNTAMMLGDCQYAKAQLAAATMSQDDELVSLSARLQVYFDTAAADGCTVAAALSLAQDVRLLAV
ncbi:hypothetical protein [Acidovorax radicis]|uniref:hypothetical protein n=1 Tax=Acidovorax radicis TaxID=758826 RepID=UPI001CF87492|nr:hypothetical protein [Acidovorax radicis]